MKQKTLTIRELLKEGTDILLEAGISEYELDAWLLFEYVTGISKAVYYGYPTKTVSEELAEVYLNLIKKRASHIPLQHLTNEQEFMGLTFFVNEHVLIPRQDTEVLVETACTHLKPKMKILDMCTGSGCILLSILKINKDLCLTGMGVDVSKEALCVAKKNAKRLGVDVSLIKSNLFEDIESGTFDMIVSNPPYIPTKVIESLSEEVRVHDPFIALDGKEDGLFFYRKIIDESRKYLNENGWLMFEIGHDQGGSVSNLMKEAGFHGICVKKDLAGLDRVVFGMYNKK